MAMQSDFLAPVKAGDLVKWSDRFSIDYDPDAVGICLTDKTPTPAFRGDIRWVAWSDGKVMEVNRYDIDVTNAHTGER